MEQHAPAQAQSEFYDPYLQHVEQNVAWDPVAPTPDNIYSPASPPHRSRVAFGPVSPLSGNTPAGAGTPSSVGLGIAAADGAAQFPGYHYIAPRDSFQQDSPPKTPPLAKGSSKPDLQPHEYDLGASDAAPYYYPQQYGGSAPPGGPGSSRFASLTGSTAWKMLVSAWPMYGMFFIGFAFAVGHHIFYSKLDGRPADDQKHQIQMMRFGGFLSYAAKAALLGAVVFAYRQQIWVTVISNVLRLRTIDSVFAAVDEPMTLLNWEFIKKARVAACLAVLAWLFPLTVILTPATLTVSPITETKNGQCHNVRTLNFEQEGEKNWRQPERINGFRGVSLSIYNSTVQNSAGLVDVPFNETFFDYWTGMSPAVDLVSSQSALTGSVIPRPGVALDTCGAGWNCSYTISFKAPGYKCTEMARGQKLDEQGLMEQGSPLHVGELAPNGNYSYLANTELGEYYPHQIEVFAGGAPNMTPPYPKNLGAFRTEPVLWIGHADPTRPDPPENKSVEGWDTAFEAVLTRCEHYLTNYTVQFNHTYSTQSTTVVKREYLHPIIDTTYQPNRNAEDGTKDNTTATPESNYVFPIDYKNYREIAAYHSLGFSMRRYLPGQIQYAPFAMPDSEVTKTHLIDHETYLPVPNLIDQIQQFYENMTLSLLSYPQFIVVTWAAQPSVRAGLANSTGDPALAYPCTRTRIINAYVYNRRDLWIAYAVAISVAMAAVVLGSAAISQNNFHVRDVHVSSVVAATRAPCLEQLPWKASKWGEVPREILETRLGYGVIAEPGPNGTPAAQAMTGSGGWMGGSPVVMGGKVYYGFAPKEVLEQTRVATFGPGKPRSRTSAWSFRRWGEDFHYK
ncbi:hypothetical protein C8A03DRAFT_40696 [Achaetomium macrosporum]|uniref:Formylmethionine deformylase-like protein n=1 Tax=Achaetomium macrosporum TaxID=79813 RepID=A0AAN7CH72_9PEZI|nr:hypothetical protein C8A03DRAFT_40696 [Achaetomium macrosporum]